MRISFNPILLNLFLLLFSFSSYSHDDFLCGYNNSSKQVFCDFIGDQSYVTNNSFNDCVNRMMSSIALPQNFILVECSNIKNAFAYTKNGVRYIIIDKNWVQSFHSQDWFIQSIIAHEIGHHLCGHSIQETSMSLEQRKQRELEADRFAGYLLKTINGTLNQALTGINRLIPNEISDVNSTHPSRSKRIQAVTAGYNNSAYKANTSLLSNETAESHLNNSIRIVNIPNTSTSKSLLNEALAECIKATNIDPSNTDALYRSGVLWFYLANYMDVKFKKDMLNVALDDYQKYLKFDPKSSGAYSNMGLIYATIGYHYNDYNSYTQAISYLNYAIQLDPNNGGAYLNRGIAYLNIGYTWRKPTKPNYCNDFYKSCELGIQDGCNQYQRACNR
jgi:tetratricopeptide (TPR) repeat protein